MDIGTMMRKANRIHRQNFLFKNLRNFKMKVLTSL